MFEYFNDIGKFDAAQLHFLRPEWFWAFIPVAVIVVLILLSYREDKKWKKVIAPALQPFMFTREKRSTLTYPLIAFLLIASLAILAMTGPSWSKVEVPGAKSEAVLMIAVDCSLSMLAEDIQPNRLERAKFKIRDLLDANPGSKVSLYAFSGTAHTVVPSCSDYRLITHHLESLSPGIMPVQGTNLQEILEIADSVLNRVEAPSTLLLVTDAIDQTEVSQLKNFVQNSKNKLEILAMATQQGAEIPINAQKKPATDANGNIVLSKLIPEALFELQQDEQINVNSLTLDNSDMELIADHIRANLSFQADDEQSEEKWKDMGYLLVILLVLLFPFWFRKGWMIRYAWLPILLFSSSCTESEKWKNLWYTKDYQAQQLYNENQFDGAAATFESPVHQGVAYYKAGNFDAAAQAFEQDSSASSLYNLSLAYTQLGRYDDALQAIQLAAEKEPDNELFQVTVNQTQLTIGLVDSLKNEGLPIQMPEDGEDEKGELNERKAASKDEELSSDTEVDELPQDGDRVTDEVETDTRKAEEMEEVPDDFQSGAGQSPQNILLREISADPGEFLRRRFQFQHKKHKPEITESSEIW